MKKLLTMVLALVLVFALGVGGTLAWLTATAPEVKNTFTTSDITVTLAETTGEKYQMVPGHTIDKNPKVTVGGDVDAYVFVKVEKANDFDTYMTYEMAEGWTELEAGVFYREVKTTDTTKTFSVLKNDKVTVKGSVTKDMMNALTEATQPTMTFTAYATQMYKNADTKFSAAEAWHNVSDPTDSVVYTPAQ